LLVFDPSTVLGALGMKEPLLAGRLKLVAALPPGLRERSRSAAGWVHLDLAGWFGEADMPEALSVLAGAVVNKRKVRFRYGVPPHAKERLVDPYGLVLKGRAWYLVGARGDRQLTYSVARVHDPTLTDEPSERPEGFDLATTWAALVADFEMGLATYAASVRVSEGALGQLRRAVDTRTREETDWDDLEMVSGWATLDVTFEHLGHARQELLALGGSIEVLAPAELRAAMAGEARSLASIYGVP
jgi:predicted DNA-binding transcriptional regulator YafY